MTRQELKQVIQKPTERMGVAFEAGLVDRVLDDVGDGPGSLPLLEFALASMCYEPNASQRVVDLTREHSALVQLLCSEIVALKNKQPPAVRHLAHLEDVEVAVPEALQSGSFFFADIQRNQVDAAGLAVLRFLAAQGEGAAVGREELVRQFPDGLDQTLDLLTRCELIEAVEHTYRFQVELIRRWFARLYKCAVGASNDWTG